MFVMEKTIKAFFVLAILGLLVIPMIVAEGISQNSKDVEVVKGKTTNVIYDACSVIKYGDDCYGYGNYFKVKEDTYFYYEYGKKVYVKEIIPAVDQPCEEEICADIIVVEPQVILEVIYYCEAKEGENCITLESEQVVLTIEETLKLTDKIVIMLNEVAADPESAKFQIMALTTSCPENCNCENGKPVVCEYPAYPECPEEEVCEYGTTGQTGGGSGKKLVIEDTGVGKKIKVKGVESKASEDVGIKAGKLYAGEKEIKIMPDTASEKAIERLGDLGWTIELKDTGKYHVRAEKKARLFFIIPVTEDVKLEIDGQTGEVISESGSWWGFLAKDVE